MRSEPVTTLACEGDVAPRSRAARVAVALERARRGELVEVFEDPRRAFVPGGLAVLFGAAGGVLVASPLGYATFLAACSLAAALVLAWVTAHMVRARRRPLIVFDGDGVRFSVRGATTTLVWRDLAGAFATPAGRRFVVLMIPREGASARGPTALPSHSEFRADELIAVVRAFGGIVSTAEA